MIASRMSVFRMNNFVRSCLLCSAIRLRNCKNRASIFPTSVQFLPKRCQSSTRDISESIDINLNEDFDYNAESPYSNIDFEAVTNGDAEKLKALKVLQLEVDLMRQQGEQVPLYLSTERWKDLLDTPSENRAKFLKYMWLTEIKSKNLKEKARRRTESYLEFKAKLQEQRPKVLTTSSPIEYSLMDTTLFHRIYDVTMNRFYNYRLLQAEWFGPEIIVDCGYEPYMDMRNTSNCAKQMVLSWGYNRDNSNPFNLIFCNVDEQGSLWQKFATRVPMVKDADSPVHFTSEHYLHLFPKKQLVYLTPHCTETLEKFDPFDVYIIGAYVDWGNCQPISLAKGKKEGLRMAKLPLDKYLRWITGHKSLTINQVLAILHDLKDGQTWTQAFRHVPRRKIGAVNLNDKDEDDKPNPLSAHTIRENYRKNLIYDLLLKDR